VGAFTAGPAIAQAVRAALVSNVDDPGRIPYQQSFVVFFGGANNSQLTPAVPPGKRVVITNISGAVDTNMPAGALLQPHIGLLGANPLIYPTLIFSGSGNGENSFAFNQQTLLFANPGDRIVMGMEIAMVPTQGNAFFTLSGYLLDCSTGPCAGIAPFGN
jgi:hypothetical protein